MNPFFFLQAPQGNATTTLLFIGVMFVAMYFFMIRPQQRKQKLEKQFVLGLKEGKKVITVSGIYGKIVDLDATFATIEVDKNVRIKVLRNHISLENTEFLTKLPSEKTSSKESAEA